MCSDVETPGGFETEGRVRAELDVGEDDGGARNAVGDFCRSGRGVVLLVDGDDGWWVGVRTTAGRAGSEVCGRRHGGAWMRGGGASFLRISAVGHGSW